MSGLIYGLCAVTSLVCAWLLLQAYRVRRITLLFWSGLFFAIQTLNNCFLIADKMIVPDLDLSLYRYTVAFMANGILLYGLIMRTETN